jgi:glycerophosphoryl diester phosphodiesterase
MRPKIIGHRGAAGLTEENTLASIQAALDANVDQVEVDVRVTNDGQVVLVHDEQINGTSVTQHTFTQLKAKMPNLCTLHEAITLINRQKPLIIEIKPNETTEPIIKIVQEFLAKGWQSADFLVASFDQKSLRAVHNTLPSLILIVIESYWSIKAVRRARQLQTRYITMNHRYMWWGFVRIMHQRGYQLSCYTLNDPGRARHLAKHGLYAIITDFPDRFKEI